MIAGGNHTSVPAFARSAPLADFFGYFLVQTQESNIKIGWILKATIDVGCNIPDVILHGAVAVFQGNFHLADGIENGGMVPGEFLADIGQGQIGQLPDQVHGHLPGFGGALILQSAPKDGFIHAVELADLGDDQAGGGQGIAFGLEHVVNGPGDIGQIQRHIV